MFKSYRSARNRCGIVFLGLVLGCGGAVFVAPSASGAPTAAATGSDTTPADGISYLYVAERGAAAVAVFTSDSTGPTTPLRVITGPDTGIADPWGVALDSNNRLFVQNYLSHATTDVFGPGAGADAVPSQVLAGVFRDSPSVAVDSTGQVYAARVQQDMVEVFAPGAVAGSAPVHTLVLDGIPRSLTVDGQDNLVVGVQGRGAGNAIEVFAPGADGAASPIRTVTGPDTGLGRSGGFMGPGETLVLTYGTNTGRIYAAVTGAVGVSGLPGSESHVSVFAADADGNAAPIRSIAGPTTGLTGATLTGIADNPVGGNIWVMAGIPGSDGVIASGQVLDFGRFVSGDVAPIRSFTDAATGFSDVQGIAFGTR